MGPFDVINGRVKEKLDPSDSHDAGCEGNARFSRS